MHGSSIGQSDNSTIDEAKCSLVRGYQRKEEAEVGCWLRYFILDCRLAAASSVREIKDPHGLRGEIPRSCTNAPAGNSKQRHRPIQQRGEIIGGQGSMFIVDDSMGTRGIIVIPAFRYRKAVIYRRFAGVIISPRSQEWLSGRIREIIRHGIQDSGDRFRNRQGT